MLYLLYGTDTQKARQKLHALVDKLLSKKPDASYFKLDEGTFEGALLEEYISGQGLFAARSIVVFDHVLRNDEAKELVLQKVKNIETSPNIFVLLEETLDKKTLTTFTNHAEKVEEFPIKGQTAQQKSVFNIFSLTDAFGSRDKGKLWVLYHKALRAGSAPEEVHSILFWQLKTILQVTIGNTEGLKPFVITKAKKFSTHYSLEELKQLSFRFVSLYHDARRGLVDFEMELERLILSLA